MRKMMVVVFAVASFGPAASAGAASTAPEKPSIPKNCHEWNQLLGIQNVRSCDGD